MRFLAATNSFQPDSWQSLCHSLAYQAFLLIAVKTCASLCRRGGPNIVDMWVPLRFLLGSVDPGEDVLDASKLADEAVRLGSRGGFGNLLPEFVALGDEEGFVHCSPFWLRKSATALASSSVWKGPASKGRRPKVRPTTLYLVLTSWRNPSYSRYDWTFIFIFPPVVIFGLTPREPRGQVA